MIEQELRELSDEEIADLGARIDAEQQRLLEAAIAAETAASDAAESFARKPSAKSHSDSVVSAQLAKNARRESDEYAAANAPFMAERTRRKEIRRLAELRPLMDVDGITACASRRIAELMKDFMSAMQTECDVLIRELTQRNRLVGEANTLEKRAGIGRNHNKLDIQYASNNLVREALVAMLGDAESGGFGHMHPGGVSFRCTNLAANEAAFKVELRFGTASNREVM